MFRLPEVSLPPCSPVRTSPTPHHSSEHSDGPTESYARSDGWRDQLDISEFTTARPVQAALTSAATFSAGAALPLLVSVVSPANVTVYSVSGASLVFLTALGALGPEVGGAALPKATARVAFWGAPAMAVTAGIGSLVGKSV